MGIYIPPYLLFNPLYQWSVKDFSKRIAIPDIA